MIKKLICYGFLAISLCVYGKSGNTTVVISLDGCRWDYPLWYDTPMFDFMAENGISSGHSPTTTHWLRVSIPTITALLPTLSLTPRAEKCFHSATLSRRQTRSTMVASPSGSRPSVKVCARLCSIGRALTFPFSVSTPTPILIMTTNLV